MLELDGEQDGLPGLVASGLERTFRELVGLDLDAERCRLDGADDVAEFVQSQVAEKQSEQLSIG